MIQRDFGKGKIGWNAIGRMIGRVGANVVFARRAD